MHDASQVGGITVVVPTYNERENLPHLLERIDEVLSLEAYDYEVVVVDDDSPDRTWAVAEACAGEYPVRVVRRPDESGLASAVVRGIEAADTDVVVVIDADLQHPPERIPDLVEALGTADVAIGSRFVDGGSPGGFGPLRWLISKSGDALAWALFPEVRGVHDVQSGFFAFRRSIVDPDALDPTGYKILLEILVMGEYDDFVEVGYRFRERHGGESNFSVSTVIEYLRHLRRLARRRPS